MGRSQGPWAPSLVPGYLSFLVIRGIVFAIYFIITFKISASASADALYSISLLGVALNSWLRIDIVYLIFDALVCLVSVESPRDSYPGVYTYLYVKYASSMRSEILYPSGSRARDYLSSSEESSSSEAS